MARAELPDVATQAASLRRALLRLSRLVRQEALASGVSAQDTLVLSTIRYSPGIGVCDLADAEQISRPAMSGLVKRLEAAGLVVRNQVAADGRRSGLSVTPEALRTLEAVRRRRDDWLAVRLTRISPADRDTLADATELLMKLTTIDP